MSDQQQVLCVVLHYNRPKCLSNVLGDLVREKKPWVRVRVYDGTSPMALDEAKATCAEHGFDFRQFTDGPHGRERDWQVWTRIFAELRGEPEDTLFCMLPDDSRICSNFFDRCVGLWNDRPKKDDGTVNLLTDPRIAKAQWTGVDPKRVTKLLWRTQWIDAMMLCKHGALRRLNYQIPPQPKARFRDPHVSTGVWEYVSNALNNAGQSLYMAHQSHIVHVRAPSNFNPRERLVHPVQAIRYVDGEAESERLAAWGKQ